VISTLITIGLGLLVFTVLVVFHELGHFVAARRVGVRVDRFSVGFGPVLLSHRRGGVEYALSAFPLGGYVKMHGDDPRNRDNLRPGDFFAAAWWRRVIIAVAGPAANFVLAILLGVLLAWVGIRYPDAASEISGVTPGSVAESVGFQPGDLVTEVNGAPVSWRSEFVAAFSSETVADPVAVGVLRNGTPLALSVPRDQAPALFDALEFPYPVVVGDVSIGTPAYQAGLEVGDQILRINGKDVTTWGDMTTIIRASANQELMLTIRRGDKMFEMPVVPQAVEVGNEVRGQIGIQAGGDHKAVVRFPGLEGVRVGVGAALDAVGATYQGIYRAFTKVSNLEQISGPVGIIQASGNAARSGVDSLLNFAMFISAALMAFNLLPVPILDGGMVMLSLIEGTRRRPVGEKGLNVYQGIGLALIGALLVFVLINDPKRIWQRHTAMDRATEVEQVGSAP